MGEAAGEGDRFPVLAVRGMVMFPGAARSIRVGREKSLAALSAAEEAGGELLIVAQRDARVREPAEKDLYDVGVTCSVAGAGKDTVGARIVLISGKARWRIRRFTQFAPYIEAEVEPFVEVDTEVPDYLREQVKALLAGSYGGGAALALLNTLPRSAELDGIAAFDLDMSVEDKQRLLAEPSVLNRYRMLIPVLQVEVQIAEAGDEIRRDRRYEVTDDERHEYLHDKAREIEQELAQLSGTGGDLEPLRERIKEAELPPEAQREADRELSRLARMSPGGPEYGVATDYVEWLAALPWHKATHAPLDLGRARRVLDRDHYDRDEVKERVLEYLSVHALKPEAEGAIMCFVGAPGVGKTSMGRSIAEATGRRFYRVSLGGVRDEAEIRGHRRTNVGALPGSIIRALRRVGVRNPVIMLDELDKLSVGVGGDPASALLEALDPGQNDSFTDNYIAVPFDLSDVLFIATANTTETIPPMLLDRIEVIDLPGYTTDEKVAIGRRYLVRRQLEACGLSPATVSFAGETVQFLVERYTREAGVRELERRIGAVCRKLAREFEGGTYHYAHIDTGRVEDLLGPPSYDVETIEPVPRAGLCATLVITGAGAEPLIVEAACISARGKLTVTGRAGEVLRESAAIALNYWKAHAGRYGLDAEPPGGGGFHVHFPAGAMPKEGAGAGLPTLLALGSVLADAPVGPGIAALGEVTLHGGVLRIERAPERLAAADRFGIRHVIVPEANRRDVEGSRDRKPPPGLRITYVRTVDEAIRAALPQLATRPVAKA